LRVRKIRYYGAETTIQIWCGEGEWTVGSWKTVVAGSAAAGLILKDAELRISVTDCLAN